jgi:hypothetical protein
VLFELVLVLVLDRCLQSKEQDSLRLLLLLLLQGMFTKYPKFAPVWVSVSSHRLPLLPKEFYSKMLEDLPIDLWPAGCPEDDRWTYVPDRATVENEVARLYDILTEVLNGWLLVGEEVSAGVSFIEAEVARIQACLGPPPAGAVAVLGGATIRCGFVYFEEETMPEAPMEKSILVLRYSGEDSPCRCTLYEQFLATLHCMHCNHPNDLCIPA